MKRPNYTAILLVTVAAVICARVLLGKVTVVSTCGLLPDVLQEEPQVIDQSRVTVTNHPTRVLYLDQSTLVDRNWDQESMGVRYCSESRPSILPGYGRFYVAYSQYGGLDPSYPVAICDLERGPCLFKGYSMRGEYCKGYVVNRDEELVVIRSRARLRRIFSPIESAEEALSYSQAVTGLGMMYRLEVLPEYEYLTEEVEDTHVTQIGDNYLVHLYNYKSDDPCGIYTAYAVDVIVTRAGYVWKCAPVPVFQETSLICLD